MTSTKRRRIAALLLLFGAAVLPLTAGCEARQEPVPEPLLVLETPSDKSAAAVIIVVDLTGREIRRQSMSTADGLPALHAASAQVAFWRVGSSGAGHELVVWNIATTVLKPIGTSADPPALSPLWSSDGAEVVWLRNGELSVATVLSGQSRTVTIDEPIMPSFADGSSVSGLSYTGERKYKVVDRGTGRTLHEVPLQNAVWAMRTGNPDVLVAVRETPAAGEVSLHALNARTGAELSRLGQGFAGPMPLWPGRNELVFVTAGELKAYDYMANKTRAVGRFEGAAAALGFDVLGQVLLAARPTEPFYGTFTVSDGRLTSEFRHIPLTTLARALGLVRVNGATSP